MVMTAEDKSRIIDEYKTKDGDTGSPEVQVALLTHRISYLTEHFKEHKKDFHSRTGLLKLVGQRRKMFELLEKQGHSTLPHADPAARPAQITDDGPAAGDGPRPPSLFPPLHFLVGCGEHFRTPGSPHPSRLDHLGDRDESPNKDDYMLTPFDKLSLPTQVGSIDITLETGKMANQTGGSVWIQSGGTVVLVTAVNQPLEFDRGFFPLTCNYMEKTYAAGRIPGGYFRREIGRPSDRETLVSRLIDRPVRPLFAKGYKEEVQIIATVLSADRHVNPDVLAITGASAALQISAMPFQGPIASARVGYVNDEFVLFPSYKKVAEKSSLNIVFAATRDAVVMVEGRRGISPRGPHRRGPGVGTQAADSPVRRPGRTGAKRLESPRSRSRRPKWDESLAARVEEIISDDFKAALSVPEKMARKAAKGEAKAKAAETLLAELPEDDERIGQLGTILEKLEKKIVRTPHQGRGSTHRRPRPDHGAPPVHGSGPAAHDPRLLPVPARRDLGHRHRHPGLHPGRAAVRDPHRRGHQALHAALQLPALLRGRSPDAPEPQPPRDRARHPGRTGH